jgi:hypothetical protein
VARAHLERRTEERGTPRAGEEPRPEAVAPLASAAQILALQRSAGNHALQTVLGGKKPDRREDEDVGGRTAGELLGDIGRPVGTVLGDIVGGIAGALGGNRISAKDLVGPTWNPNGHFDWGIEWETSGRNGWIVQEVVSDYRFENAGGAVAYGFTPRYWEAWPVDDAGKATPVDHRGNDDWIRSDKGADTKGHWSMRGTVYWTDTDPATQGFAERGVREAGDLLATTSAPTGLGVPRDFRYAQGHWDSTVDKPYHDGSAM